MANYISTHSGQEVDSILDSVSGKYVKPETGIPKADLAANVQTSLGKADSALQTHQDISGKANLSGATFTGNINIPVGSNFNINSNQVIKPFSERVTSSPMSGTMLWHDLFAFCKLETPSYYTSNDGTTWTSATVNKTLFAQKGQNSVNILTSSVVGARWVWGENYTNFGYSYAEWLVLGITWTSSIANYTVTFETSTDNSTWSVRHVSTQTNSLAPIYFKIAGYGGDRYLRLTITKETTDTGTLNIGQIRLLTSRYGDQGRGIELEYPYTWDADQNITFTGNITASSLIGNASTATKATQDESGNNIKASYAASMNLSNNAITLANKNGSTLSTITATQAGSIGIDATPTQGSNNLVKSGGVYEAISQQSGGGDAVKYTAQTLTDNQKTQARTNIGAVGKGSQNNVLATATVS